MVDVTLQIILEPSVHDLSYNPERDAMRYRRGDIHAGHLSTDVATFNGGTGDYNITEGIGSSTFGYIHITGVPVNLAVKARSVLSQSTSETGMFEKNDPELGPIMIEESDPYRICRWRIPRSVLPPAMLTALLADREITTTWALAKPRIRRKIVAVRLDPLQDDETNAVVDGDLE